MAVSAAAPASVPQTPAAPLGVKVRASLLTGSPGAPGVTVATNVSVEATAAGILALPVTPMEFVGATCVIDTVPISP
jgi:hypothetical protein